MNPRARLDNPEPSHACVPTDRRRPRLQGPARRRLHPAQRLGRREHGGAGRGGFAAIASTSAGIAFSLGKQDYQVSDPALGVSRDEMFARMAEMVRATARPVSGDLEAGWGDAPSAVAETLGLAVEIGLAGGNIEDKIPEAAGLYDEALAAERIAAGRAAVGHDFVLNARTDVFQLFPKAEALEIAIRRGNLFFAAGADCVFTPGVTDLETARVLAAELKGPLNLVIGLGESTANARDLLAVGVRRISLGGSIARSALGFVRRCAAELRDQGSISFAAGQIGQGELNGMFAEGRR